MTPLEPAVLPPGEVDRVHRQYLDEWTRGNEFMRKCFPAEDAAQADVRIRAVLEDIHENEEIFKNDVYQVSVRLRDFPDFGPMVHLSIKRIDKQPCHDWRDFQAIKNQLCGPECEGVEIYPAESRLADTANQYHLWVIPAPGVKFPFGFNSERLVNEDSIAGAVNRPFNNTQPCTQSSP